MGLGGHIMFMWPDASIDEFTIFVSGLVRRESTNYKRKQVQHSEAEIRKGLFYCIHSCFKPLIHGQALNAMELYIRTVGRAYCFQPTPSFTKYAAQELAQTANFPIVLKDLLCFQSSRSNLSAHARLLITTLSLANGKSQHCNARKVRQLLEEYNPYFTRQITLIQVE